MNKERIFQNISKLYWIECCKRKEHFTIESWANNAADNNIPQMLSQLAKSLMLKRGVITENKELWNEAMDSLEKLESTGCYY